MKKFKKIMAIAIAMVMMAAMAIPTMAATVTMTTLKGHTYEIFQIFTGTVDTDGETLTELKYGASAKGNKTGFVDSTDLAKLKSIQEQGLTDEHAIIEAYSQFVDFDKPIDTKIQGTASIDLEPGYYVIRDEDDTVPEGKVTQNDTTTLYMFKVLNENLSTSAKAGTVERVKKVDDNDADGKLIDSADYNIGDTIPYTLTFKLPENYEKFEKYYVKFIDNLTAGLTYNGDAKIYYGASDTTGTSIDFGSGLNLAYEITNLKAVASNLKGGDVLTIKYTCYLNASAKIGSEGNPNTYKVQFSNNPNKSGDGDHPKGETPEDKNIVFTYKTVFNKIDENKKPLTGADFTLYKDGVDVTTINTSAHPQKIGTSAGSKFEFKGLDAGEYELRETTTPKGYNTIEPITFTITAKHEILSDDPRLTSLLGDGGQAITMIRNSDDEDALTSSIMNKSGAVLPSTGGIGTTIFYVVGAILAVGAGILLVTRRRMSAQ